VRGPTNIDFARQLAERKSESQPPKKFRSSAAPKGTKLAAGYRDRTRSRADNEGDEKAQRIKALEESMKLGQIDRETFERLVENITGGDIEATHLVKGLDRKLLERVRRGEDVLSETSKKEEAQEDLDEEFEKLVEKTVAPVVREKAQKKGEMAPPPPISGIKRSRNTILAELKASRKAAAEAVAAEKAIKYPELGPGFRKVGEKRETTKLEKDDKGRDILIITDEDGNAKRKVRKMKQDESAGPTGLDKTAKPLDWGVKVPDLPQAKQHSLIEDEEDDDIFEGVGTDYNPLAELGEAEFSTASEDEDGEVKPLSTAEQSIKPANPDEALSQKLSRDVIPRRNYFDKSPSLSTIIPSNPLVDPNIIAALKRVQKLDSTSSVFTTTGDEDRLQKRATMLSASDRDFEDMDLGFGSSRFGDAEEMESGEQIKLSEWNGTGTGKEDRHGGSEKRKRGPKKRKGDKNSAADVLKVMEKNKESEAR
jgi:RED-like protein N-terminal region